MRHVLGLMVALALPCVAIPSVAWAEGFCGATEEAEIFARLAGDWAREGAVSLESETESRVLTSRAYGTVLTAEGMLASEFVEAVMQAPQPMVLTLPRPYDVDRVDDVLETTARADLADVLSDTLCGPEALPQLVVPLEMAHRGMSITGQITLIPYFDDRILEITETTNIVEGAVIYLTETALLRPGP